MLHLLLSANDASRAAELLENADIPRNQLAELYVNYLGPMRESTDSEIAKIGASLTEVFSSVASRFTTIWNRRVLVHSAAAKQLQGRGVSEALLEDLIELDNEADPPKKDVLEESRRKDRVFFRDKVLGRWGILGEYERLSGLHRPALASFCKANEESPDSGILELSIAKTHLQLDQLTDASSWFKKAEQHTFWVGVEALADRMDILRTEGRFTDIVDSVDAVTHLPSAWANDKEGSEFLSWEQARLETEDARLRIARNLGFAEGQLAIASGLRIGGPTQPAPESITSEILAAIREEGSLTRSSAQEETRIIRADIKITHEAAMEMLSSFHMLLDALRRELGSMKSDSDWALLKKVVSQNATPLLETRRTEIAKTVRYAIGDVWERLEPVQKDDLITAEFLYESFQTAAGFSWRGALLGFYAPAERLAKEAGKAIGSNYRD